MAMLLYYFLEEEDDIDSVLAGGFADRERYGGAASSVESKPRGVELTDDPILLYEHCGGELVRVELSCSENDLGPFEDLLTHGFTDHLGPYLEEAWCRYRIPLIGTTYRRWIVPAEVLRPWVVYCEFVDGDPAELWMEVARNRRPPPDARLDDPIAKRLAVLARTLHGRPFNGERGDDDQRPGMIAIQESWAIAHFENLVKTLTDLKIPLERCGWLLAEAARRVAVDSYQHAAELRQERAARARSADAEAQDDPEVRSEAERLRREGVPVARIRRRLIGKFGRERVPSETVIRRRWLRYVRVDRA